jgi:vacuolar-type H+-ATPase subunit I/STV1
MRTIAIALIAVIGLMVIGCQPPEGMVTSDQIDELKTEIQTLKTEIENLHTTLEEFTTVYNEHIEKYHKGGKPAPKPQPKPEPPPVQK